MSDTIKLRYSSSKNITFNGFIETDITKADWAEMSDTEQNAAIDEYVYDLVDISVVDE